MRIENCDPLGYIPAMNDAGSITVVETAEFLSAAKAILDESARFELLSFLSSNPEAGDIIRGTGGVRKLRWALKGRGKSGGARIIYYYHNRNMPLFIFTAYAKNRQDDLDEATKKELKKIVAALSKT
ncbi:type II toxin-antitoxin system RelE/ParE family toxin [Inquilinus sp. CAU 1745]|uniref:type II toxin-antitoxin system RelE/ParE family toxin n=1 Tax=Inquilinus sp. CAU 1745 TaxID=3140369 RepID=UPI00325B98B4